MMVKKQRAIFVKSVFVMLMAALLGVMSCGEFTAFVVNNTTALGGGEVLDSVVDVDNRGDVTVSVANNTPYFVSVTFGSFDPLNESLPPNYTTLTSSSETPDETLGPFETGGVSTFYCGREVSLGDSTLVSAIFGRLDGVDSEIVKPGIIFSDKLLDDPDAQIFTVNNISNQVQRLGVDYQCDSLIQYVFEQDANEASGIRIDVTIVLP